MKYHRGKIKAGIMEFLKGGDLAQTGEIAEAVGRDSNGIMAALRKLEAKGAVENPHRGVWRIAAPGNFAALKAGPPPDVPVFDAGRKIQLEGLRSNLYKWLAQYSGPEDNPVAVEVVLAFEHVKRAVEFRDGEVIQPPAPKGGGCDEGLRAPYKTVRI